MLIGEKVADVVDKLAAVVQDGPELGSKPSKELNPDGFFPPFRDHAFHEIPELVREARRRYLGDPAFVVRRFIKASRVADEVRVDSGDYAAER